MNCSFRFVTMLAVLFGLLVCGCLPMNEGDQDLGNADGGDGSPGNLVYGSVEVEDDDNGDGILNPGESNIWLRIMLLNRGGSAITSTSGTLHTASPYVTIGSPEITFYRFNSTGSVSYTERTCDFCPNSIDIAPETPPGTVIDFRVALVDDDDQRWQVDFQMTVQSALGRLVFRSVEVEDDDNSDGVLNPGEESIWLRIGLENQGSSAISTTSGTLRTASPYVTIGSSLITFYRFNPAGSASYTERTCDFCPGLIDIAPETPPGTIVDFRIELTDGEEQPWVVPFTMTVR
jgi:hypothetical protein